MTLYIFHVCIRLEIWVPENNLGVILFLFGCGQNYSKKFLEEFTGSNLDQKTIRFLDPAISLYLVPGLEC